MHLLFRHQGLPLVYSNFNSKPWTVFRHFCSKFTRRIPSKLANCCDLPRKYMYAIAKILHAAEYGHHSASVVSRHVSGTLESDTETLNPMPTRFSLISSIVAASDSSV